MSEVVRNSLKSAAKGTALMFAGTVVSIGIWFAAKILIVRNVTKEELGLYSLAVAVVSIASLVAGAGLQDGVTRYVSMFLGEGRDEDARGVSRSAVRIGVLTGVAASALVFVLAGFASRHVFYKPEFAPVLKASSAFCFFFVYSNVLIGIIRGYGFIQPRVYFINIGQPIFFVAFLSVIFIADLPFIGVLYSYVLAIAFAWACVALDGARRTKFYPVPTARGAYALDLLKFSLPLLASAVMGLVFNWTDTLMLGRYAEADMVGVYSVSVSLVRLLTFALGAAGFVFMPIAGDLYAKGQSEELKRTFQVLTKWIFMLTFPVFFVLLFFPEMTITFLFGERYVDAAAPLRVLSLGYMFNVFVGVNIILLIVTGRSHDVMNISIVGTVLNIVLNYLFIKRLGFGMMGAATATAISFVIISILNALALYRHSDIQPLTWKYIRPIVSTSVVGVIIYALAKSLPLYMWMMPLYCALFILAYGVSVLVSRSLEDEDLDLMEAIGRRVGVDLGRFRRVLERSFHIR